MSGAMMQRREFLRLLGGIAALPITAHGQQANKIRSVGFLYPGTATAAPPRIAAFLAGLRAGGFREPEDVELVAKITGGDAALLDPMAADLASRKVDLILAVSPAAVRAARSATTTIPIVANDLESDPVDAGFVASVARPGGNLSGVFLDFPDFGKKWLELLKETVPQLTSVGVFWDPATGTMQLKAVEAAAQTLKLKLEIFELRGRPDEGAVQSAKQRGVGALLFLSSPFIGANTKFLAGLVLEQRLPAMTLFTDFARDGGLMAYGPNLLAYFRQGGVLAAKILHGAKSAELPIETPTKFEFVLNLQTAKILGINIPPSILLRADEVIE
jgi:putative tryptophan/tyrosine transport system substrate-binding protein